MMGDFSNYNDYELLYLARENIDEAKEVLIWKYSFLIKAKIHKLRIPIEYWDDFYQEGCVMLIRTIKIFNEFSKMSFTNFFDLLLGRRYITLLRKEYQNNFYDIKDNLDYCEENKYDSNINYMLEESYNDLSKFEQKVYQEYFILGLRVEEIAKKLNVDAKSVSNAKQRIIKKLKNKIKRI